MAALMLSRKIVAGPNRWDLIIRGLGDGESVGFTFIDERHGRRAEKTLSFSARIHSVAFQSYRYPKGIAQRAVWKVEGTVCSFEGGIPNYPYSWHSRFEATFSTQTRRGQIKIKL